MEKDQTNVKSYRKGAWTIGHVAAGVTGSIFERHGLGRGEVAHAWPHIAGPDLALVCRPEHIAPARKGQRGGNRQIGGTLHIVTSGAHAIDVHYAAGRIISGVNALYGHEVVSKIIVKISDTDTTTIQDPEQFRPSIAPPEDPDRFEQIHVVDLRQALARLEAGILADSPREHR